MLTKGSLSYLPHRGEVSLLTDRILRSICANSFAGRAALVWDILKNKKPHSLLPLVVCLSPGAGCCWVGGAELLSPLPPAAQLRWPAMPTGMHGETVQGESCSCAASTAALSTLCSGFGPAMASVLDGFGSAMQKNTRRLLNKPCVICLRKQCLCSGHGHTL